MFGGTCLRTKVQRKHTEALYAYLGLDLDTFHFDCFELRDGELYYRSNVNSKPLMMSLLIKGGRLREVATIKRMLSARRLHALGFNIPMGITHQQATVLNRMEEELPSTFDIAKAHGIELQEITENAAKSTETLITQFGTASQEMLPIYELQGLDKQVRSICSMLKVELVK